MPGHNWNMYPRLYDVIWGFQSSYTKRAFWQGEFCCTSCVPLGMQHTCALITVRHWRLYLGASSILQGCGKMMFKCMKMHHLIHFGMILTSQIMLGRWGFPYIYIYICVCVYSVCVGSNPPNRRPTGNSLRHFTTPALAKKKAQRQHHCLNRRSWHKQIPQTAFKRIFDISKKSSDSSKILTRILRLLNAPRIVTIYCYSTFKYT